MLKLFRKNHFLRSLLLLPLSLVLHIGAFKAGDVDPVLFSGIFQTSLYSYVIDHPGMSGLYLSLIMFLNAVLINRLAIINRLCAKISLFPGAMFIVLCAFVPPSQGLTTMTFALFFLVLFLTNVCYTRNKFKVEDKIFNVGFFAALVSIFYPPAILLLAMGVVGLAVLRQYKQKEFLNLLNGFLLPHFFVIVYFIWNDSFNSYLSQQFGTAFGFWSFPSMAVADLIQVSLLIISLVFVLFTYPRYTMKKEIQARKKIDILFWSLLFSLFILLLSPVWTLQIWFLALPALSILLGDSMVSMKNEALTDAIYIVLFITAMAFQFVTF